MSAPFVLVALATGAGLFTIAFSGGAYDVVTRQTASLVIWWTVGLGALAFAPAPRRPSWVGVAATAFAALIAGWITLNIGDSISQERSAIELARAVTHLGPIVLIGWALPRHLWRAVFAGLLLGAVALSIVSLGSRLSPGFLRLETAVVFTNTTTRLAAPLGYWNAVGSWSVITTLLLLATSSHATRLPIRALALGAVPIVTTVGYMTYSRSALGAVALGLIVLVGLSANRWTAALHALAGGLATLATILSVRAAPEIADATGGAGGGGVLIDVLAACLLLAGLGALTGRLRVDAVRFPLKPARIVFAATVVLAIASAAIVASTYGEKAWNEFKQNADQAEIDDPSQRLSSLRGSRIAQWESALDTYRANKAHGTGAGTFELSYSSTTDTSEFVRDAHNVFLETLSEQGLLGLLVLVAFLLSVVAAVGVAVKRAADTLERGLIAGAAAGIAAFTLGTAIDWFWEVTALATLTMALVGVIIAAGSPGPTEPSPSRRRGWPLRAGLVAAALLAVLIQLPGLVGTSEVRRSASDVAAGELVAARAHADTAIDTMPWASSPFLQRALVDEQAGEWDSARRALQLAIERDPKDWRLPLVLSRVEARAGRPKAALAAYRQGKALRPGGQFFR